MSKYRNVYGYKKRVVDWKKLMWRGLFVLLIYASYGAYSATTTSQKPPSAATMTTEQRFPSPEGGDVAKPRPIDSYGRPFSPPSGTHMIAIVLMDVGFNQEVSSQAIEQLPPEIAFGISPLAPDAGEWVRKARAKHHEVLATIALEPDNYPANDPGPQTLLTSLPETENLERLAIGIQQISMAVGITHTTGSNFTTDEKAMEPVMRELRKRGMLFLDTLMSPYSLASKLARKIGTSFMVAHHFFGENPEFLDHDLKEIQVEAQAKGYVVAVAPLSPFLLQRLKTWMQSLPNNVVLAPLTAVMKATNHDAP